MSELPSFNTIRYRKYSTEHSDLPRLKDWQVFSNLAFGLFSLVILVDLVGMMLKSFRILNNLGTFVWFLSVSIVVAFIVAVSRRRNRNRLVAAADARVVRQAFAPRARISIIGSVESLEDRLNLDGIMFEPETFNVALIFGSLSDPEKSIRYLINLPGVLFITPLIHLSTLVSVSVPVSWHMLYAIATITLLTLPILEVIRRFIRRSYIRVSPGRLEIIDYRLLRSGVTEYVHVDLRTARIAINLIDGWIVISRPRDEAVHIPLLAFHNERGRLVDCILEAAMAEQLPPPLAVEELSGHI